MPKIEIEVRLSDEDRKLLAGVESAAKAIAKGGKPAAAATGKPAKAAAADDIDDFDATDDATDDADDTDDSTPAATKADVQAALRDYAAVSSKADAIKLMKKHGGSDQLSALDEDKYQAVIDAAKAATKKAKK